MKKYLVGLKITDCEGVTETEVEIVATDNLEAQSLAVTQTKDYDNKVSVMYVKEGSY